MNKQVKYIRVDLPEDFSMRGSSISEAIAELTNVTQKCFSQGLQNVKIDFYDLEGNDRVWMYVVGERPETDEECSRRIAYEKSKQEERVACVKSELSVEIKELQRLAKKHGFQLLSEDRCVV